MLFLQSVNALLNVSIKKIVHYRYINALKLMFDECSRWKKRGAQATKKNQHALQASYNNFFQ